jgi:hypothetical protein
MNKAISAMMLVLTAGLLVTVGAFTVPVYAGGSDHHDHGETKCKNNDDNNCNKNELEQKVYAKNDCEVGNDNEDHSRHNENDNRLRCINDIDNINEIPLVDTPGG